MPRDYKVYLEDIRNAIARVKKYTAGLSREAFGADEKTVDAVVRNLEIIGEAVKMIPESIRQTQASIEWKKIAGLRDILAHQYFGIDVEIIWDILENKLPPLVPSSNVRQARLNGSWRNFVKKPPPPMNGRPLSLNRKGSPHCKVRKVTFEEGFQKFTSSTDSLEACSLNQ